MLSGNFLENRFVIAISVDRFCDLWDDSYEDFGEYNVSKYESHLCVSNSVIDLDSFVADQILTVLNSDGREDCDANNEYFEDYAAEKCIIKHIENETISIEGNLVRL
jgi:hypothetical protein